MTLPPITPLPPTRAFDAPAQPQDATPPPADEIDEFTRAQAALAEVVTVACATLDTLADNPDLGLWIGSSTRSWTIDHARQALFLLGTVCQAYEVQPAELAELGRIMLHGNQ